MVESTNWHTNKLNHFHTVSLRKLLSIKRQDKSLDIEVLTKADLPSIHSILMKSQLQWAEHVVCMSDYGLPEQFFYGELRNGKRAQGGQKRCFKDSKLLWKHLTLTVTLGKRNPLADHSGVFPLAQLLKGVWKQL